MPKLPPRLHAFTLSEFIIALAILGVIAAFTIPSFLTNVQERQRLATFRENFLLVESVLKKYCASPDYGTAGTAGQFYGFFVNNVGQVQDSSLGTNTTATVVTFRNGSRITIDPNTDQIIVQWDANEATDAVTLDFNPVKHNDLIVNGRNLKACEVAPQPSQMALYAEAVGLRADSAPSAEYVGNTSQLINPDDVVVTNTNAGGTGVDGGHQYGARDGGFT
ncbi:MAG: type II secretion system GspH family protein [Vampirovibrionales bacterium]|jgi:prepilin-type N-terminal cleavage/methylation domain-containing protein|nr:type II secretion system GspH family protein [Vampirovibrionales bacterium]